MNQNSHFRLRNLTQVITNYIKLSPEFKIIVVEQNGNGEVESLLKQYNVTYLNLQLSTSLFHKTKLLNHAISKINSDYIIMSDADCILTQNSIDSIRTEYNKGIILYPFSSVNYYTESNTRQFVKDIPVIQSMVNNKNLPIKRFTGLVNCFSKETFNKVGGFDEEFIGWGAEDDAFVIKCERLVGDVYRTSENAELIHLFHPKVDNSEYKKSEVFLNNKRRVAVIKRMNQSDIELYVSGKISLFKLIDKYTSLGKMNLDMKWQLANTVIKLDTTIYDVDSAGDMTITKFLSVIYDLDGSIELHKIIKEMDSKVVGLSQSQQDEINKFRLLCN